MSFLKTSLSFILVFSFTSTLAQIDPDFDGIGIYFDQAATANSAEVVDGTESVTAYLTLTTPSCGGNLVHWAARVSCDPSNPYQAYLVGSPINGTNLIIENMPGSSHWSFEVSVYDEPPYPISNITLLAELTIFPVTYGEPIYLFVTEGPEHPSYGTDEGWAYYQPSSGNWGSPVAVINGEAPVPAESHSWGHLKSLFR